MVKDAGPLVICCPAKKKLENVYSDCTITNTHIHTWAYLRSAAAAADLCLCDLSPLTSLLSALDWLQGWTVGGQFRVPDAKKKKKNSPHQKEKLWSGVRVEGARCSHSQCLMGNVVLRLLPQNKTSILVSLMLFIWYFVLNCDFHCTDIKRNLLKSGCRLYFHPHWITTLI